MIFIGIFVMKMGISVAPIFLAFNNNKVINAVILQLELEGKDEKDTTEKESAKEKKFFDEDLVMHCYAITPVLLENNLLHNQEHALPVQTFHPVVPTPPPNA
ncbi:hypothetical protein GCM10028827_18340 [Mucilaginibacter myungsuensis]